MIEKELCSIIMTNIINKQEMVVVVLFKVQKVLLNSLHNLIKIENSNRAL